MGISQTVCTYTREKGVRDKNRFRGERTKFVHRPILRMYHRALFHLKTNTTYNDLKQQTYIEDYDLVDATTLFTDGAVAYKIHKNYGIPYVVMVRNTDINEFLAVAPHTWAMGMKVLRNARRIVFISKAPMEKFCRHWFIRRILPEIQDKFVLQPNGVDDYWLEHVHRGEKNLGHQLIYVGRFDVNKNVVRLIHAVLGLAEMYPDIRLHLVGGDGWREKEVLALVRKHPKHLVYHGKVYDKNELRRLYGECSVFAMPSVHETFGLVYIEALTQNLAVVYTRDQGIDGLLDERIGEKVNALSTKSIQEAIGRIFEKREEYLAHEVVDFEQFRWERIAEVYSRLFNEILI